MLRTLAIAFAIAFALAAPGAAQSTTLHLTITTNGTAQDVVVSIPDTELLPLVTRLALARPQATKLGPTASANMVDGTVFSVGADGTVYRNGLPFGSAHVSVLVLVGSNVFAKGTAAGAAWVRWDGTYTGTAPHWVTVPAYFAGLLDD